MRELVSQLEYSQLICSLLYIFNRTKPGISYAVGRLSRYTSNPNTEYWTALEEYSDILEALLTIG